jgi:hypothetical protein
MYHEEDMKIARPPRRDITEDWGTMQQEPRPWRAQAWSVCKAVASCGNTTPTREGETRKGPRVYASG